MDVAERIFHAAHTRLKEEKDASDEAQLEMIARFWTTYLGIPITENKVAEMMILLKVARATCRKVTREDDYVDMCGYAALAFENTGVSQAGGSNG